MASMKVEYQGSLRTICIHGKSGDRFKTDAPTDNNGKGEAFSPTDLVGVSLASCMITVMGIAAQSKGLTFETANAEVTKTMSTTPRRIAKIQINLQVQDPGYTDSEKELLKRAALQCPVTLSLHPDIEQLITLVYV
ncbi:MAG: putative redox protein [Flavobacteriales bacterium]|jgi:putative redox protein